MSFLKHTGTRIRRQASVLLTMTGICLMMLIGVQESQATHIVGGDITYRCLGGGQYEIRLTIRRDCFLAGPGTEFDDPAWIGIFAADHFGMLDTLLIPYSADDTLNQILISDCTIAGMDVCVHTTSYVKTITLPFYPGGYIFAYQRCCRNMTVQNVNDPLNTGMTITALLTAEAQLACKSSPVWGEYPPIYICVNEPIAFDFSATDNAGDSLVYEFFTPNAGATNAMPRPQPPPAPPYQTVVWNPPYSLDDLLNNPDDPLTIDAQTGLLTGTPLLIGQFLVGVRVRVYRGGDFITAVTREFQYNVRACRDVPIAALDPSTFLNCQTLDVDFTQQAVNADEFLWIFDFGNPGSATSMELNPSFTFDEEGFYQVALIVNDADSICFDTAIVTIGVFESMLSAEFSLSIPECAQVVVLQPVDESVEPNPDYDVSDWLWILSFPGGLDTATGQAPSFTITESMAEVMLTLIVTSSNGCTAEHSETFQVSVINVPFEADTLDVCEGGSILLVDGNPDFQYTWSPAETLDLTNPASPVATPVGSTTYFVTVTDGICVVTDQVHVAVQTLPDAVINPVDTSCFGAPIVLNPGGNPGFTYQWSPTGPLNNPNVPSPIADVNVSTVFYVTITDPGVLQCQRFDSVFLFVPPDIELGAPIDTAYCFDPPITLVATGQDIEYTWFSAGGDVIGTGPEITVQPSVMTTYILAGEDIYGCEVQRTVTLSPTFFNYSLSGDELICEGETVVLSVFNHDPSQQLEFLWTPSTGIIGPNNGPTVLVSPPATTTYTVQIVNAELEDCVAEESITVTVSVFVPSNLVITAVQDTVLIGEVLIISTNQDPGLMYQWSGPGIENPNLPVIHTRPELSGVYTYSVTITNEDGCKLTGTISNLVVLSPLCDDTEIFVPSAFSPNGDGQNDVFQVYGNYIDRLEMRIFNRWGEEVFFSNDQNNPWDGTYKGKELPPDVYGYYLMVECVPDKRYFTKGNVTLFR